MITVGTELHTPWYGPWDHFMSDVFDILSRIFWKLRVKFCVRMHQNYAANNLNCFGIIQFLRRQMNKLTIKLHAGSLVITVIYPARLKYNLIFAYFHIVRKIISTVRIRLCTTDRIKTTSVSPIWPTEILSNVQRRPKIIIWSKGKVFPALN
jgi:hypothetical protein